VAGDEGRVGPQVEELKRLLERELEATVQPYQGCWPLAVAIVGVLLAVALLLKLM